MTGSGLAAPAWGDFMHDIHVGKPYKPFFDKMPSGIVRLKVCAETGCLATKECKKTVDGYFLSGTEPKDTCETHLYQTAERTAMSRFEKERKAFGMKYDKLNNVEGLKLDLDFLDDGSAKKELMEDLFSDDSDFEDEDEAYEGPSNDWTSFFSDYMDDEDVIEEEESSETPAETQESSRGQQNAEVPKKVEETAENESTGTSTEDSESSEDDMASFFE